MTNPHPASDHQTILQSAWEDVIGGMEWLQSVIYGEFADHRSLSAIVADLLINFVPGVVIVTSARDATAIILRLATHPEKRQNLMEWVLLSACLIVVALPIAMAAGGAVAAGVGAVVGGIAGTELGAALRVGMLLLIEESPKLVEVIRFLQKFIKGDILGFLRAVKFAAYEKPLLVAVRKFTGKLIDMVRSLRQHLESLHYFDSVKKTIAKLIEWEKRFYAVQEDALKYIPKALALLDTRKAAMVAQAAPKEMHAVPAGVPAEKAKAALPPKQRVGDTPGKILAKVEDATPKTGTSKTATKTQQAGPVATPKHAPATPSKEPPKPPKERPKPPEEAPKPPVKDKPEPVEPPDPGANTKKQAVAEPEITPEEAEKLRDLARKAHAKYAEELEPAKELTRKVIGDGAVVSGRAKEPGSAANRLERAVKNGWAKEMSTPEHAVDNLWDAVGTRALIQNPTPEAMNKIVDNLDKAIRSGELNVTEVRSLVGEGGVPYLNKGQLLQLQEASRSVGKEIAVKTVPYDTGYTAGMVYFQMPSGVRGEMQLLGPKVLEIADAEHIPYDAILGKPYAGAFSQETLPGASAILDPLRASAQGLTKAEQGVYYEYLTKNYTNARLLEQEQAALPAPLPDIIPENLSVQNLLDANKELSRLKRK